MKETPNSTRTKSLALYPTTDIGLRPTWKSTDTRGVLRVMRSAHIDHRVFWQRYVPICIVHSIVRLSQIIDPLFAPSLFRRQLPSPIFVVGVPRSGTTFLYHLLSTNPGFVCPQTYETILPSVILLRLIRWIGKFDRKLGKKLRRWVDTWLEPEAKIYEGIHQLRWRQPEEDEQMFLYRRTSPSIVRYFPFEDFFWQASLLDDLSQRKRKSIMKAYTRALHRIMHARGAKADQFYLAKNVYASGRIKAMLEHFPSAKWIHIVRDPKDVVPSALAMMMAPVRDLCPSESTRQDLANVCIRLLVQFYQRLIRFESLVDSKHRITVQFDDLVRDPRKTIESVYQHFDWTISDDVRQRLVDQIAIAHTHRSSRKSSLSDYGLEWDSIRGSFEAIRQHYGLPP